MTRRNGLAAIAVSLGMILAVSGCTSGAPTRGTDVNSSIDSAEVRTDREPIEKRFPALGAFIEAHWIGGTLGDDRVPGPSTYFIEAVVTLAPAQVAALRESALTPAPAPQPPASLAEFTPVGGSWTSSSMLPITAGPEDWDSTYSLRLDEGVAYVSARGE